MLITALSIIFIISIALLALIGIYASIQILVEIIRERCIWGILLFTLMITSIISTVGLYMLGVFE